MRRRALVGLLALAAAPAPDEPQGYRTDAYGAPTPATLRGATVLSTQAAYALWRGGAAFIDVLPRPPRPAGLPADTIWHVPPRADIPGSLWLPDTGYGELAPVTEAYLRRGLDQATHGDRRRALVFYCKPRCWMSWNAAKRALALGYARVSWYPEGADGWRAAGFPLETSEPMPGQPGG
jgi:PQQ-dependent catabolism-associated CXXCW motif protein